MLKGIEPIDLREDTVIIWNKATKRFELDGRPPFADGTRADVLAFQNSVAHSSIFAAFGSASPRDKQVGTLGISKGGTPYGTNLNHHISIHAIETMVVDYLNGDVSVWVFLNFVGHVVTPSWLSLADSIYRREGRVLSEWTQATLEKFQLALKRYRQYDEDALAIKANDLSYLLNSAKQNLRFGDDTTNLSINDDLDARLAHGWRLDPVGLIEMVWSKATGRPVLSAETSSFLNAGYSSLGDMAQQSLRDSGSAVGVKKNWLGGVAMSESMTQIATTKSNPFNPVMGEVNPAVSVLRGHIGLTYSFISRDTLLPLFAIVVLYLFMKMGSGPLW